MPNLNPDDLGTMEHIDTLEPVENAEAGDTWRGWEAEMGERMPEIEARQTEFENHFARVVKKQKRMHKKEIQKFFRDQQVLMMSRRQAPAYLILTETLRGTYGVMPSLSFKGADRPPIFAYPKAVQRVRSIVEARADILNPLHISRSVAAALVVLCNYPLKKGPKMSEIVEQTGTSPRGFTMMMQGVRSALLKSCFSVDTTRVKSGAGTFAQSKKIYISPDTRYALVEKPRRD